MQKSSLVAIIVVALSIVGIVIYLARPRAEEFDVARPSGAAASSQPVSSAATPVSAPSEVSSPPAPSAFASCIGPVSAGPAQIAALHTQHQYARSLVEKNHFETALPALRSIAVSDPGYPGINLEISEALLKSRHAAEASDAINVQVEMSDCLAKLPPSDVEAYCKSQSTAIPEGGCRAELAKIDEAARREAKLVKIEVAKGATPMVIARSPMPAKPAAAKVVSAPPVPTASPAVQARPAAPAPPVMLKADEASAHVGERATVCGTAVSKTTSLGNGKPTFINLDHAFPNQTFTVVVFESDVANTGELPGSGNLCVTGTIALYRGTAQIVVHDAKSWSRN